MRRNEISATGVIDKNGRLNLPMDYVRQFFGDNKGQRVIATFHIVPPATSTAMVAYYFGYIVPEMTRAAYEMAHDPRNINILCFEHHNLWESAVTRKGMKIYGANEKLIEKLKKEYR